MTRLAYTYIRWSSEKQSDGASLERQTRLINQYVKQHGLTLANVSYKDVAASAAKGKNATEGALGAFIAACVEKKIKSGSYLLVEAFDRLSRAEPMDALRLFQDIVDFGITVVTLEDGQAYDRASIKKNWTQLIIALSKMVGAHDENEKRTRRVQDAWLGNRSDGGMLTSAGPAWLKLIGPKPGRDDKGNRLPDTRKWVKIPEQVAKVERVFELAVKGHGAPKIADLLNAKRLPTMTEKSELWTPGVVMAMLKNENVIGVYQRRDGTDRREGYYPPIIDKDDFYTTAQLIAGRHRKGRHVSDRVGSLFGSILFCPCGSKMRFVNGNPVYSYVRCIRAYSNAGCDAPAHPYNAFEESVLDALLWTFHAPLTEITQIKPDPRAALMKELEDKEARLERLYDLLEEGKVVASGGLPGAQRRADKLESELVELRQKIQTAVPEIPFDDIAEQALVQLNTHNDLKAESNDSPELNALRLEMKGTIRLLLSKIVIFQEHTFVKYHPRAQAEYKREGAMFGKYEFAGPVVERIRPHFAETGAQHILAPNLEHLNALGEPTIDGMFGEFVMLDWAARDAIKRRRKAKPKA